MKLKSNSGMNKSLSSSKIKMLKLPKPLRIAGHEVKIKAHRLKTVITRNFNKNNERHRIPDAKTDILFSIILCADGWNLKSVAETIKSCLKQDYDNWELCVVGTGCTACDEKIRDYINQTDENKIRYLALNESKSRAGMMNAAVEMSNGSYIIIVDDEGFLASAALREIASTIQDSGADLVYSDEIEFISEKVKIVSATAYKPDFSPDTLRSYNYIGKFIVVKKPLLIELGLLSEEYGDEYIYDVLVKISERTDRICHIPSALFCRVKKRGKRPYYRTEYESSKSLIESHLKRINITATVEEGIKPYTHHIVYALNNTPLISVIIPNKDHTDELHKCIESLNKSSYKNVEIIVIENNSTEKKTFDYYESLKTVDKIKIVQYIGEFNYSAINNLGVRESRGDYILLLNNDIEAISENWIEEMLMYAQRNDVGAVGAMLYYPDNKIQHAGVIVGLGGVAAYSHKNLRRYESGYMCRAAVVQNLSAVTAACLLTKRNVWEQVGGLDENYMVAFNDVDFCLKIRDAGYLIVWTPYAELYHYESKSRGADDTPEKAQRSLNEAGRLIQKWRTDREAFDPYYNKNLTQRYEDFSLK